MPERLLMFDFLRTVAIFIIFIHHLPNYTLNYYNLNIFGIPIDLSPVNELNRYLGIGLFIFISGYLLNIKKIKFPTWSSAGIFLYKRLVRILPIYYLALIVFCLMLNINNPLVIITHIFGLQSIFATNEFRPIITLWFIGTILVYYLIFIILNTHKLSRIYKIIITIAFPIIIIMLSTQTAVTDIRMGLYYFIFMFGIYCANSKILDNNSLIKNTFISTTGLCIIYGICIFVEKKQRFSNLNIIIALFLINALILSFVIFVYNLAKIVTKKNYADKTWQLIAYCSYAMYLFHRPVWFYMVKIMKQMIGIHNNYILTAILVMIGIPLIVTIAYLIQTFYDKYVMNYLYPQHLSQ